MRKRYILFTYDSYYPSGGLSDIQGRYDTLDEIKVYLESIYSTNTLLREFKSTRNGVKFIKTVEEVHIRGPDYWEVLDLDTGDEVNYAVGFVTPKSSTTEISLVPV